MNKCNKSLNTDTGSTPVTSTNKCLTKMSSMIHFEKCVTQLIATSEVTNILIRGTKALIWTKQFKPIGLLEAGWTFCHAYLTSKHIINKDDYFINNTGLWQHNGKVEPNANPRRVEVTTNSCLNLPDISIRNVIQIVDEYNKGNTKLRFVVKYEGIGRMKSGDETVPISYYVIVNDDNTAILETTKNVWNIDDVINILAKERQRAIDLCYTTYNQYMIAEPTKGSVSYKIAEECRFIGNAISGRTGLSINEDLRDIIIRHYDL